MARPRLSEAEAAERKERKRKMESLRRQKIKSDPNLYKEYKEKESLRYLKRVNEGKIKLVKDLSSREHRARKKEVRERVQKCRLKKQMTNQVLDITPPLTPTLGLEEWQPQPGPSRKDSAQKRVKKQKAKVYRKLEKEKNENERLRRLSDKYRKRFERLQAEMKKKIPETPKSKVEALLSSDSPRSKQLVKKTLIFGETITHQLNEKVKTLSSTHKQIFVKTIGGDILKKYRCLMRAGSFFSYKIYKSNRKRNVLNLRYEKEMKKTALTMENKVIQFLNDDNHSTQCPGKRDFVKIKSKKYQKRYLNDTQQNLHKQFCSKVGKISYPSFCRFRPKNIVAPKLNDRDTCLCVKHENMKLLFHSLYLSNLVKSKDPIKIIDDLCCEPSANCMLRKCCDCKDKNLNFPDDLNNSEMFSFKQWVTIKEKRVIKGENKEVKRMIKEEIKKPLGDVVKKVENELPLFMTHCFNIRHQNNIFRQLRGCSNREITLQIDFSENYCCKYAEEPQSVHFGASRQQLSLHTGVAYSGAVKLPFCTVSANLRRDAKSVAAHLEPILAHLFQLCPDVQGLNFISDGPTGQYRNRTIFTYIGQLLPFIYPQLTKITWNYCEAGHGKGPADGVGGALKRRADKVVAHNADVQNLESFINVVAEGNSNIKVMLIQEESFTNMDNMFKELIAPVKNTMKVHQVLWRKENNTLQFNALSCIECDEKECIHWKIAEPIKLTNSEDINEDSCSSMSEHEQAGELEEIHEEPPDVDTQATFSGPLVQEGQWVAVMFEQDWFLGLVESDIIENEVTINFMARSGRANNFYWPTPSERRKISADGMLYIFKKAPIPVSRRFMAIEDCSYVDFLSKRI